MDSLVKILKILVALGLVAGLLIFGFVIFAALLAVACVTAGVLWVKKQSVLTPSGEGSTERVQRPFAGEHMTIIEGEAEEVTVRGAV